MTSSEDLEAWLERAKSMGPGVLWLTLSRIEAIMAPYHEALRIMEAGITKQNAEVSYDA